MADTYPDMSETEKRPPRPPGRPPAAEDKARKNQVCFKMTRAELEAVNAAVAATTLSRGAWIRERCLAGLPVERRRD